MSARLTVVVVQAEASDSRTADYEQQILTRIMLENSLDAVLVGPLEKMKTDDTDLLCLSKLPVGSQIVGWMPEESFVGHFQRLGLEWQINKPSATSIRYRKLSLGQSVDDVINDVLALLREVGLRTLQITLPGPSPLIKKSTADTQFDRISSPRPTVLPVILGGVTSQIVPQVAQRNTEPKDNLDQLVDDLESLDL